VEPIETNVEPSGDGKHIRADHEEFSVEPREQQDVGIKDGFEKIKEEGREKDAKDGNKCLFGGGRNQET